MDRWIWGILSLLMAIDGILIIARVACCWERETSRIVQTGTCKTIGGREVQEDAFEVVETADGVLGILADGMGKQYGGKAASYIAVETFIDIFKGYHAFENPLYFFRRAFHAANREILNKLDEQRGAASVAVAMIRDGKLFYALVGDIQIAVYRGTDLIPVSDGHTIDKLAEKKYLTGNLTRQDAVALLEKKRLYNYLGQDGFRDIEFFDTPWPLRQGDIVLLMSDGVYNCLAWKEIEEILSKGQTCERSAFEIVEAVNQKDRDDKDNASVVLLRYK